jgi:hypothetical protein
MCRETWQFFKTNFQSLASFFLDKRDFLKDFLFKKIRHNTKQRCLYEALAQEF